jgi:predicted Rossmann-fold nucleotide-binding protein
MRIAIYLGSSFGCRAEYAEAAAQTGRLLAQAGLRVVYGGSSIGLMGALASPADLVSKLCLSLS